MHTNSNLEAVRLLWRDAFCKLSKDEIASSEIAATDLFEIAEILNAILKNTAGFAYLPRKGTISFVGCNICEHEDGCIELVIPGGKPYIVKPGRLNFDWPTGKEECSFFLLTLMQIKPTLNGLTHGKNFEDLIRYNGEYVDPSDIDELCDDRDEPDSIEYVCRYLQGKILIVPPHSPWQYIPNAELGIHERFEPNQIRSLIAEIHAKLKQ